MKGKRKNQKWLNKKEPPLPSLKLRRENVGMYTRTWFQDMLCDILYDPLQGRKKIQKCPLEVTFDSHSQNFKFVISEVGKIISKKLRKKRWQSEP